MYHYVRPVKNSLYPKLAALEIDDFKRQIDYFCDNFNIIAGDDFINIINSKKILDKPSFVLTFDDGFLDHYEYVFPYLKHKKVLAYFYPPTQAIKQKKVLDVHKIHFILEKEQNRIKILKEIDNILFKRKKIKIDDLDTKVIRQNKKSLDDKNTIFIKRLLQFFLPAVDRELIVDEIFKKIINEDSHSFAKKIYMSSENIKEMDSENMIFGLHGNNHLWWKFLKKSDQKDEINKSLNFYTQLKLDTNNISVCYPYGSYNKDTIDLLKDLNVSFGLTTNHGNIDANNISNKYEFPRFDTNELKL
jgi:peptidoglycan/xylan/chitin deacetylase (PgdA/CDA1 family)